MRSLRSGGCGVMVSLQKPKPKMLTKHEARVAVAKQDREENAKVKQRSQGQCEVRQTNVYSGGKTTVSRCHLRASQVHHLISGIGRRNVGDSISAKCKLHVCDRHHSEIHGHVIVPVNSFEREDAATVVYERWMK
jgi:hypothetical protein